MQTTPSDITWLSLVEEAIMLSKEMVSAAPTPSLGVVGFEQQIEPTIVERFE